MCGADVTNILLLFARSPEWAVHFDMDAEMAGQTGRWTFDQVAKEKMVAGGFRFPFFVFGTLETAGKGHQLVPVA